jgi:hypothetical protein
MSAAASKTSIDQYKTGSNDQTQDPEIVHPSSASDNDGESFDNVPKANRRLGTLSATMLIANRMIGTGIFATPASILSGVGSIGLALFMWVIGAIIAAAGLAVYLVRLQNIPRPSGQKMFMLLYVGMGHCPTSFRRRKKCWNPSLSVHLLLLTR